MTCTWMLTWESVSWKHDLGKLFCLWNSPTWVLELFFSCHTLSDVILCLFYLSSFFFHSSCISHSRFFSSTHASLLHRDKATLAELCIRLDCVAEWGLGFGFCFRFSHVSSFTVEIFFLRIFFQINNCYMKQLKSMKWYNKAPNYAVQKEKKANTIIRC